MATPIDNPVWNAWRDEVVAAAQSRAADVVGTLTELKSERSGRWEWKGKSPWRQERTPSFYIDRNGLCHDFGTGETKDVVGCVMLSKSCGFREALDYVAAVVGVDTWDERKLKNPNARGLDESELAELRRWQTEERRVQELITYIVEVCAHHRTSRIAAHYARVYGFDEETQVRERLGYIPAGLFEIVCEDRPGVPVEDWLLTGFFYKDASGAVSTSRCQRLLFPYWRGGLCAYTIARLHDLPDASLDEWEKGKYQKHPTHSDKRPYISTTISNKWLWNEDAFSGAVEKLLITEGIADGIALKQHGYSVVSPVTTSFREEDWARVTGLCRRHVQRGRVVVVNDADVLPDGTEPGLKGAIKTARVLWLAGLRAQVGQLPRAEGVRKIDCCDYLRDGGEDARARMDAVVAAALDYPRLLVSRVAKTATAAEIAPHLPAIAEAMVPMDLLSRADLEREIAGRHRGLKAIIKQELKKLLVAAVDKARAEVGRVIEGMVARDPAAATEAEVEKKASARTRGLHGGVLSNPAGYYERGGTGREQVSTFSLAAVRRSEREDGMQEIVARVDAPDEGPMADPNEPGTTTLVREWLIPHKAWGSKRAFIAAFPNARMQWTGSDDDVQGVMALLTDEARFEALPRVRSTPVLGRHVSGGSPRFVLPAGTLSPDGWMAEPDQLYRRTGNPLDAQAGREQSPVRGPEIEALAREAIPMLFDLHAREVTTAMAGWFCAAPLAPIVRQKLGGFPLLCPWGEQGSGKSTIVKDGFGRLFYQRAETFALRGTTPFAMAKLLSHANALPVLFDEHKAADMGKNADLMRRRWRVSYSGETELRGHQDLTVSDYPLCAPLVIAGETRVEDDPALVERFLYAPLDKSFLAKNPRAKALMERWRELEVWKLGASYCAWTLSCDAEGMLAEARAMANAALGALGRDSVPERVRANLAACLLGLIALERWAATLGANPGAWDAQEIVASLLRGIFDDEDGGAGGAQPLTALDRFVSDAADLISLGLAEEGRHWTRTGTGDRHVALRVPLIEGLREEVARRRGGVNNSPGANAILRIARDQRKKVGDAVPGPGSGVYVIGQNERVVMKPDGGESARLRCLVIDPALLPAATGLDAESFPKEAARATPSETLENWRGRAPRD